MSFLDRIQQKKISLHQEKFPVFGVFLLFFGMFLSSLLFFSSPVSAATPPSIITYQGKLLNAGTAVNATSSIQLRIYDALAAGSLLYTASGTTGAPLDLSVPVDNGIFSVNMGGSGTNALSDLILADNATLYLEVWVEGNQMSPRKRLTATPYALNSAYLMGYGAATVSTTTYIPVSDATGNFNFSGSIIATGTATSSFTNVLINDGITLGGEKRTTWPTGGGDVVASTTNNFTGTNTFYSVVDIKGKIATPTAVGNIDFGAGGGFVGVVVRDKYAYMTNGDDGLRIVDVSDPANPISVGHENTNPFDAGKVTVAGNYAYVTYQDGLSVIDISDPSNPQMISSGGVGESGDVVVVGNYAYTVDTSLGVTSIDISDPFNLQVLDTFDSASGNLRRIEIVGKYAYLVDQDDGLLILDISDPTNLIQVGSVDNGSASSITLRGRYAYVGDVTAGAVDVIDISDPTSPTVISTFVFDPGESPSDMIISGNYLFVAANSLDLAILDLVSSTAPVRVGTSSNIVLGGSSQSIFSSGNYLYIASDDGGDGELNIVDITGAKISNADVGTLKVGNIESTGVTQFQQSVFVRGGLSVGNSGLLLNGDFSMMTATNSISATNTLRFTNTALFETSAVTTDTQAFIFNTSNSFSLATSTYLFSVRNNGTPTFSISASGDVHTTGTYYGNAVAVSTPGAPGDLAERVDIALNDSVEPGDVVVVDPNNTDTYRRSTKPYAQEVSGVISTNPTIVVGSGRTQNTAVMAMVGRVPIKVSDENGPIVRGDLLITASSTGHAMRYDPTKDVGGKIAGIVGVALESLPAGKGKIMGLVRTGWVNGQDQQIFSEMRNEISKLTLGQGGNNELNVSENNDGSIVRMENDLDLNGFSILSVKSIKGLNEKWEIDEDGRFITRVETTDGPKTLYALQTGESQYVFSGNGTLVNGKVRINFDETILDIIDTKKQMSINLTLTQKAKGVYVSQRDDSGFDVEEIGGGESNATFDWLIFATRKNGDENEVMEDQDEESGDENSGNREENSDEANEDPEAIPPEGEENNPDPIVVVEVLPGEVDPVEEENSEENNDVIPAEEPVVENNDPLPEAVPEPPAPEPAPAE